MMKNFPTEYLKPENLGAALMNLRRCLSSGLTVEQMAKEIIEHYKRADLNDKASLGKLLTAVYDFADPQMARKCADLFGVFQKQSPLPDRPLSYLVFKEHFYPGPTQWLCEYSQEVKVLSDCNYRFDHKNYWMVVDPFEKDNVIVMGDDLYCIIDSSMRVHFLVIEDHSGKITIDEKVEHSCNAPLYRTEDEVFISPVYKVKVAKKIMEYCLEKIGFPNLKITTTVLFRSGNAILFNKEDYVQGGVFEKQWEGVKVYDLHSVNKHKGYLFESIPPIASLISDVDPVEGAMMSQILYSIEATSAFYERLVEKGHLRWHSHKHLSTMARRMDIFFYY